MAARAGKARGRVQGMQGEWGGGRAARTSMVAAAGAPLRFLTPSDERPAPCCLLREVGRLGSVWGVMGSDVGGGVGGHRLTRRSCFP